jgi:large subunit ribosomal protein L25
MKEPEKPAEAEAAEGEETSADGKDAAPAAEGDKKEGEEKKAPPEEKK